MKIVVIGTRGIPEIQGGVETHCQELYPRIVAKGHDVTVIRRSCYVSSSQLISEYKGIRLTDVFAPRKKSLEAIVHTFLAVLRARRLKPDILHIHAIGPALFAPMARLLGMKVVMTNHGPDYDRQKWGRLAKSVLRLGEWVGTKSSNRVIVISQVIADILKNKYGRKDTELIFNGVNSPRIAADSDYIESLGLEKGKYIIAVGRFVEEKGFHDLIEAFRRLMPAGIKLAIAGDADHEDEYSRKIKELARNNDNVVLTGFIRGEKMRQLMSHASLFCLPSYHEGLPIALLEAMSYGLDVAVSDIPANRLRELNKNDFFHVGDVEDLKRLLTSKLNKSVEKRKYDLSSYDWDHIADQTIEVYRHLADS